MDQNLAFRYSIFRDVQIHVIIFEMHIYPYQNIANIKLFLSFVLRELKRVPV